MELLWGSKRFHKCLVMAALFYSLLVIKPSPPSSLGTQTSSQAILALCLFASTPAQKKTFNHYQKKKKSYMERKIGS